METAGLTGLLKQEGSYTVFAPTDDAFDGLSREDLALLKSEYATEMNTYQHPFIDLNYKTRDRCRTSLYWFVII